MTEPDGTSTSQAPAAPGATAAEPQPAPAGAAGPAVAAAPPAIDQVAPAHPTAPVTGRPAVRRRPRGPLTRMGPWAPVAGALVGVVAGVVAVLLLADAADDFRQRLSLVFLVVGLALLGASGTLLADEVRTVRWRARQAAISPDWVGATAGLVDGLTPARLLLLVSGFVLFLSAFVAVR